jgi:hypothetical protein
MSENLIIRTAQEAEIAAAIERLGVSVETTTMGDARMYTCRREKTAVNIRVSQPRDWRDAPILRDHEMAIAMVGSLFHRTEANQLRDEIVAALAPYVVSMDALVEQGRAAREQGDAAPSP